MLRRLTILAAFCVLLVSCVHHKTMKQETMSNKTMMEDQGTMQNQGMMDKQDSMQKKDMMDKQ